MSKLLNYFFVFCAFLLFSAFIIPKNGSEKQKQTTEPITINWISIEEAIRLNEKSPKKMFIDVYAPWCGWCKKLDNTTLQNPDVVKYINENYYAVKLNAESKDTITLGRQKYKFVSQGRVKGNELALSLLNNNLTLPSMVILEQDFSKDSKKPGFSLNYSRLSVIPGYLDAPKMDKVLRYFGDDYYKKVKWAIFDKKFKSRISR